MKRLSARWTGPKGRLVVWAAAVTMVGVLPASAQIEEDVAAGYLNVSGTGHGGFGQLSVDMGRRWGVFGQVDATAAHDPGVDTTMYRDLGVLGGVRYRWQPSRRVSPFWQLGVGVLHSKITSDYVDFRGRPVHNTFTVNFQPIQPGGGVTVMMTRGGSAGAI